MNVEKLQKLENDIILFGDEAKEYFSEELLEYLNRREYLEKIKEVLTNKYGPFKSIKLSIQNNEKFEANNRIETAVIYSAKIIVICELTTYETIPFEVNYRYSHSLSNQVFECINLLKGVGSHYFQSPFGVGSYIKDTDLSCIIWDPKGVLAEDTLIMDMIMKICPKVIENIVKKVRKNNCSFK